MRPSERNNVVKAGIFFTISVAFVVAFTMLLSRESSLFESKISIYTFLKNADGIKTGAPVALKGIKIGSVADIQFLDLNKIHLTLKVAEKHAKWIKKDSYISIKTQGVLGDKFIEILGGSSDSASIENLETLVTNEGQGLDAFIDKGENILVNANSVIQKLDLILNQIGQGNKIEKTMNSLESASTKINKIISKKSVEDFGNLISNLSEATDRINKGPGTIHSFIYNKSVYNDLENLLGGAQRNKLIKYFIRESINKSEQISK